VEAIMASVDGRGSVEHETEPVTLAQITSAIGDLARTTEPVIVGVTGSVASGKSDLAAALAPALGLLRESQAIDLVASDGFLLPNAVLAARGLETRKGFPETYDLVAMAAALTGARVGPTDIPVYSHVTYDIDPSAARRVGPVSVLVVEGLALGLDRPPPPGAAPLIDCLVYLDASEADLEAWFVVRFMHLWRAAEGDPGSFYHRFRHLDAAGAEALARMVWREINLPNLRQHIAPVRAHADIVVRKGPDHRLAEIVRQDQPWR
jgi:type I pantothenate kinase